MGVHVSHYNVGTPEKPTAVCGTRLRGRNGYLSMTNLKDQVTCKRCRGKLNIGGTRR